MKVLVFQQRGWGIKFGHYLARRIQEKYPESTFAAIVLKQQTLDFVHQQREIEYQSVLFFDDVQNNPDRYIDPGLTLADVCAALGVESVWPMMQSMRNQVRDYSRKYYYSFRSQASEAEMRALLLATFSVTRRLVDDFMPDIIITPNFVAMPHVMMSLYGRRRGVPMVGITDSKIRGINLWVRNHNEDEGEFFEYYRRFAADPGAIPSESRAWAAAYLSRFRATYIVPDYTERALAKPARPVSGRMNARRAVSAFTQNPWVRLGRQVVRGSRSAITHGVTIDNRPRRLVIRDFLAERSYARHMANWNYDPLPRDDEPFAFFPLQYQPEASVDVLAPHFNNQIEVVRQVAMSLPDDFVLVVKEHPGMIGKRPPSYLEKIQRLPNVRLVDHRVTGYDVIRRARILASINSTACVEAAFLGVPAVQFGNLGTTLALPHVHKCTDFTRLGSLIRELCLSDFKAPALDASLLAYIAAAHQTGFETNYAGMWEYGESGDKAPIWDALLVELERVDRLCDRPQVTASGDLLSGPRA